MQRFGVRSSVVKTFYLSSLGILILVVLSVAVLCQSQGSSFITIPIHLSDKKDPNKNIDLTASDVYIVEDGKALKLLKLATSNDPIAVGLVVDISGSTQKIHNNKVSAIRQLIAEVKKFSDLSFANNEYFLAVVNDDAVGFSSKAITRAELAPALDQIGQIESRGNTRLFDAVVGSLEKLSTHRFERKILFVISDGQDNRSTNDFNDLRDAIRRSNVSVFGIFSDPYYLRESPMSMHGEALLEQIVFPTGGRLFRNTKGTDAGWRKDVLGWGEVVDQQLRHTFYATLEMTPSSSKAKWRKLNVKFSRKNERPFRDSELITRSGVYF